MRKGVREASLSYEELGRADALSLVCIRLHTGRTHQIRVQFSSRGLPLLGDRRYGSRMSSAARRSGRGSSPSATPSPASPSPAPTSPRTNTRGTCFKKIFPNKRKAAFSRFSVFYAGAGALSLPLGELSPQVTEWARSLFCMINHGVHAAFPLSVLAALGHLSQRERQGMSAR